MADHAGFAAAVTVRERALDVALEAAYANGSFPTSLAADLPGGPPGVSTHLFLGPPAIACEGATNLLVLTLAAWGPLHLTLDGVEHDVEIAGELEMTLVPVFGPGASLTLEAGGDQIVARRWTARVLSAGTPADVAAYVVGDDFRQRLEQAFRLAVAFRLFALPSIDVRFFGPLARLATSVDARVRNGALLLGLDVDNEEVHLVGDVDALADFAHSNDVAGVVNAAAVGLLLDDVHTQLLTGVQSQGATLDGFAVTPRAGFFLVTGAASSSGGTVNFSFRVVPSMSHTRPGKVFGYLTKPRRVSTRTWAALDFRVEGVETDVDRAWWVVLFGEVILGILTVGFTTLYVEDLVGAAAWSFSTRLTGASPGAPAARVRRTIGPPGGMDVRIGVDQFDVTPLGTAIGLSVRATPTSAAMLGPLAVPSTYADDVVRYQVRLPSGVRTDDQALRVHWTLEDRTNGVVVLDQDGPAAGRLRLDVALSAHPDAHDLGAVARLYRRLGVQVRDLATVSLTTHVRDALPAGAYVRWRSQVKNPQVGLDVASDTWTYLGEAEVKRWSEWHRTDAPCHAVGAPNRYRYQQETADRLPFSLRLLENHRAGLCPYCFYGGPAGVNPSL